MSSAALPHVETSHFDRTTNVRPRSNGWHEWIRREQRYMGMFLNVTLQAAVHHGRDSIENARFTKKQLQKSAKLLFQLTEKLINDQTEISGLTTIDNKDPTCGSMTQLCDTSCRDYECHNLRLRRLGDLMSQQPTDKRKQNVDQFSDVDYVPTNTHSSQGESQLYICEDNEAVIRWLSKADVRRWIPNS